MTETLPAALPREIVPVLDDLQRNLVASAGENLQALILYGGTARGRYRPDSSDINVLLILRDASVESLQKIAPVLHDAGIRYRVEPFLVTTAEFSRAAELFPTKFIEIRNHHRVLYGLDPFVSLHISRRSALLRIEQELRNLEMRLRQRFISIHALPDLMTQTLRRSIVPIAVTLESLVEMLGRTDPLPDTRAESLLQSGRTLRLDMQTMESLAAMRSESAPKLEIETVYARVLQTLDLAAQMALRMSEKEAS